MIRLVTLAFGLLFGAFAPAHAQAPSATRAGNLSVIEPWSRATPGGARVGAGYLRVENAGQDPDRLLGAEAEVSEKAELHETRVAGGVARMVPMETLPIPPAGRLELKPGGYHLMLTGLKRPLKEGERFAAILIFEKAGRVPVSFVVRGLGAGAAAGAHHHH